MTVKTLQQVEALEFNRELGSLQVRWYAEPQMSRQQQTGA